MSKEKVRRYKKEKAVRKLSLKKEKRMKTALLSAFIAIIVLGTGAVGYYSGNRSGYSKGYAEGFSIAAQIYNNAAASGGAIASGTSVTTDSTSGSAATTDKNAGK